MVDGASDTGTVDTQIDCSGEGPNDQACAVGYHMDHCSNCIDINECETNRGGCDPNATCTNTAGTRVCTCQPGFAGDGLRCERSVTSRAWQVDAFVKASRTQQRQEFAVVALSADGTTLAVGANQIDSFQAGATRTGEVHVFTWNGEIWNQQAVLTAGNAGDGDAFGISLALSSDGNTLAVGASSEDSDSTGIDPPNESAQGSGAAYVFTRTNGAWSQQAFIKASRPAIGDRFGFSLSLSADGNTLAVGCQGEDSTAIDSGAVYVFARMDGTWLQQALVKSNNAGRGDGFGVSVALSTDGNTLAVGAFSEDSSSPGIDPAPDDNASGSGAAYVFLRVEGAWIQRAYLKASNPGEQDSFGISIAISADGSTLAVGATGERSSSIGINAATDDNLRFSGAVYVFSASTGTWRQEAFIKAGNSGPHEFGNSVDLSDDGDLLVVGAWIESSSGTGLGTIPDNEVAASGAVYTFTRENGGAWRQEAFIKATNTGQSDRFGGRVTVSGNGSTVAVGAPYEDSAGTGINPPPSDDDSGYNSGAVYTYRRR